MLPIEPPGLWNPLWEAAVAAALARLLAVSAGTRVAVPDGLVADTFRRALDALLPPGPPTNSTIRARSGSANNRITSGEADISTPR